MLKATLWNVWIFTPLGQMRSALLFTSIQILNVYLQIYFYRQRDSNTEQWKCFSTDVFKCCQEVIQILDVIIWYGKRKLKRLLLLMYLDMVLVQSHIRKRRRIAFRHRARMNACACQQRTSAQQHDSKVPK